MGFTEGGPHRLSALRAPQSVAKVSTSTPSSSSPSSTGLTVVASLDPPAEFVNPRWSSMAFSRCRMSPFMASRARSTTETEAGRPAALARGTKMQGTPARLHLRQVLPLSNLHFIFCFRQLTASRSMSTPSLCYSSRKLGGLTASLARLGLQIVRLRLAPALRRRGGHDSCRGSVHGAVV